MWGELRRGWSFLSGLPSGGMAVLVRETEQVLLLDPELEPTAAVTIPGLRAVWDLGVAVGEAAGLVVVSCSDGLRVYEPAGGALGYRLEHRRWGVDSGSAWSSAGTLWTVVPTPTPAVDSVVAIRADGWTTLGQSTVRAPSTNQAFYWLLPVPNRDLVGVLGALADSDGCYLCWSRWDRRAVAATTPPLLDHMLTDVDPNGREFLAVTQGSSSELVVFDLATGSASARLALHQVAGVGPAEDLQDTWDESAAFYLAGGQLVAMTSEGHVLLLDRTPLRVVAELHLEGCWFSPFDGCQVDVASLPEQHLPFVGHVQRWTDQRLIVPQRMDGTRVHWIYDLSL